MIDQIHLSPQELDVLSEGLKIWLGPARPSDLQIAAFGFPSPEALEDGVEKLLAVLGPDIGLDPVRITQALMLTEIAFASDIQGAGWEWSSVSGIADDVTIQTLRSIQHKLIGLRLFPGRNGNAFSEPRPLA